MLTVEPQLIEAYVKTGKVKLVFRDVLNHGERSDRASEAAVCAGRQGKFWDMHAMLFEKQGETWGAIGSDGLVALMKQRAREISGLDQTAFAQCIESRETLSQLQAADAKQRERGIITQPIFEIGDRRIVGTQSFDVFAQAIDALAP